MCWVLVALFLSALSIRAQTITQTFGSGANAFSIDFVKVANPGNAPNTDTIQSVGSVAYTYNIGKYEVSRDIINKANVFGSLGITLGDLSNYGGNGLNRPASGISWNEAARFVNWLNTSKGFQLAYNFSAGGIIQKWDLGQYTGTTQYRNKDAYYFLPNLDEWHKAAYYDPNKPGGAGYWKYPTKSDNPPVPISAGTSAGTVVYDNQSSPADITNAGGLSAYGTMAQGGNVSELTEEWWRPRGGGWRDNTSPMLTTYDSNPEIGSFDPSYANFYFYGFRVAMIPEPSTFSLLAVSLGGLVAFRRRK